MADAGQIYANYGAWNDWAMRFESKNKELRQTLDDIKNKINSLQGDYESDAATTIRQKITGMTPRFDQYQNVVDEYSKFVKNQAQAYSGTVKSVNADAEKFQ